VPHATSRRPLPLLACALTALWVLAAACAAPEGAPTPGASATQAPGSAVSFATPDGITLSGRLFGGGPVAVALAHMYPSDASSWFPMAARLGKLGYTALAFNFRGYDGSGGSREVAKAAIDLRAAYDFLKARGSQRVALVGASMGGTASLIVAAEADTPAVVVISAPAMFQDLDAQPAAPKIPAPVLLLAASGDGPAAQSLRTLSALLPNREPKLFDGGAHGTNLLLDRPESADEVVRFLSTHAPSGSGATPAP
jgi:pimeloyl-ACP methyl ester carboxylesterase